MCLTSSLKALESVPMLLITVLVVMKHVQSMSSPVTPVRRYRSLASVYEYYMLAVHGELPNSTQRNVAKGSGSCGRTSLLILNVRAVRQNLLRVVTAGIRSVLPPYDQTGVGMNCEAVVVMMMMMRDGDEALSIRHGSSALSLGVHALPQTNQSQNGSVSSELGNGQTDGCNKLSRPEQCDHLLSEASSPPRFIRESSSSLSP
ncbi:hypothetical protein Tco_0906767 [Tanacetum coccineum]|uniref:Secreted protein n=1 Tax=Tanacetum coccineum TaxID=301880 RepID=A0ABQ5CK62_9ASTR